MMRTKMLIMVVMKLLVKVTMMVVILFKIYLMTVMMTKMMKSMLTMKMVVLLVLMIKILRILTMLNVITLIFSKIMMMKSFTVLISIFQGGTGLLPDSWLPHWVCLQERWLHKTLLFQERTCSAQGSSCPHHNHLQPCKPRWYYYR